MPLTTTLSCSHCYQMDVMQRECHVSLKLSFKDILKFPFWLSHNAQRESAQCSVITTERTTLRKQHSQKSPSAQCCFKKCVQCVNRVMHTFLCLLFSLAVWKFILLLPKAAGSHFRCWGVFHCENTPQWSRASGRVVRVWGVLQLMLCAVVNMGSCDVLLLFTPSATASPVVTFRGQGPAAFPKAVVPLPSPGLSRSGRFD